MKHFFILCALLFLLTMSDHVIECYLKTEDFCKRSNPKAKCPITECDTKFC